MKKISFASDNYAGVHPAIMQAISDANQGHVPAYGNDDYTAHAITQFKEVFGRETEVFFVFNGTGANVTGLLSMNRSYHAVICAEKAHIQVDECGAPEKFTGSKLLLVPTVDGKITVETLKHHLQRLDDEHHVQAHVISISQSTEYGTVYTPDEIKKLADFAHQHQMYLHMDGARISNAAASLNIGFKELTKDVGVDVLSFGGTKNGMMLGEAVVFFDVNLAKNFQFIRKQSMQLASKMRFISAQFLAFFHDNLWHQNAKHANDMANYLFNRIAQCPEIEITQQVQANAIFARFSKELIAHLHRQFHFYVWDEVQSEVRIMTSFNTRQEEVDSFIASINAFSR